MAYIKDSWLMVNQHAVALSADDWYAANGENIDRHIERCCEDAGVSVGEIPVDTNGNLNSLWLIDLATDYCLYRLFENYAAIRDTTEDTYEKLSLRYYHSYKNNLEYLTRGRIL